MINKPTDGHAYSTTPMWPAWFQSHNKHVPDILKYQDYTILYAPQRFPDAYRGYTKSLTRETLSSGHDESPTTRPGSRTDPDDPYLSTSI